MIDSVLDIQQWNCSHRLKLNAAKSEVTWLGMRQQLAKLSQAGMILQVSDSVVQPSRLVRTLLSDSCVAHLLGGMRQLSRSAYTVCQCPAEFSSRCALSATLHLLWNIPIQSRCHARILALTAATTSFSCRFCNFVIRSSGFMPVHRSNQPRNVKR